ncbi:4-hydroxybenzoate octaprenyltransferase [Cupriavidus campinensis]
MSDHSAAPPHPRQPGRLALYARLVRIDKPIGTLLLLWPTLWALWMAAEGPPAWGIFWIFVVGTFLMRSAGCAINDWADRDFDKHVKRTKERPLTAGRIAGWEALVVAAVLALAAFALVLPLNGLTKALAVVAAVVAATYPFFKRFFAIPQAYLGIAFGFGIPMAFAAVQGQVPAVAWLMLLANVFWAVAYDTAYAMVDRDDDLLIGIKTSAITFGRFDVAAIMVCYAGFLGLMAWAGVLLGLGWAYYAGLAVAAGLAGYHYTLIRDRDRMRCFAAFRHNNWLGGIVFAGTVLAYWLK